MRKLVWCGAAVMVAGAFGVFMAARHAADHPDSFWGRCTAAVADIGFRCNPFVAVSEFVRDPNGKQAADGVLAVGVGVVAGAQEAADEAAECAEIQRGEVAPDVGAEKFEAEEPPTPIEAVQQHEIIEPVKVPEIAFNEGNFDIDEEYAELLPMPKESDEPADSTNEESEPLLIDGPIPMMPPVIDDMPAGEEKEGQDQAEGGQEACCDWLAALMHAAGLIPEMPPAADEPEVLPMPTPCADDEEQGEGVEELPGEEAPPMPQGYDYHHYHHDSCPYMGCPYPYSHTPSMVTPVEPPAPKVKKKKVHHQLDKPAQMESLWQQLFGGSFEESEPPMHTGIDTMEFRPSDDPREPPGHHPF